MRSWICDVCAHFAHFCTLLQALTMAQKATAQRRSPWIGSKFCQSSDKFHQSFRLLWSQWVLVCRLAGWFEKASAAMQPAQFYKASWSTQMICPAMKHSTSFHRKPEARKNSDLLCSGYAGLIAKIRCSFLLGCSGFWIQHIFVAMRALLVVIITDLFVCSALLFESWIWSLQGSQCLDVQYPGTFSNEDFCIPATYIYMLSIFQGALI